MRTYQVTRKMQVTIPNKLAKDLGIGPGDSVVFEKVGDVVVVKRAGAMVSDYHVIRKALGAYARDIPKIKRHMKTAEKGIVEGLSRYLRPKR